jgi:ribosomal protein L40E
MNYLPREKLPTHQVCTHCGELLPVSAFGKTSGGTYRKICRKCKYKYYDRRAYERRILRELSHDSVKA